MREPLRQQQAFRVCPAVPAVTAPAGHPPFSSPADSELAGTSPIPKRTGRPANANPALDAITRFRHPQGFQLRAV